MRSNLAALTASELVELFRRREASPVEATRAALAQIERFNSRYNAFCLIDAERALRDAAASEARWLDGKARSDIDGVPTTIKDIILTKGWPTLRGSRTIDPAQDWNEDAPAAARLREAGAVLLGKTTTPEFGWKAVCDSPLTGITRNPWDERKTSGGSSGGAGSSGHHHAIQSEHRRLITRKRIRCALARGLGDRHGGRREVCACFGLLACAPDLIGRGWSWRRSTRRCFLS